MHPVTVSIARVYTAECSHVLPNVPKGHKCGRVHGHSYAFEIELSGRVDTTLGWLVDFAHLDEVAKTMIVSKLDHHHLNDVEGLANPTSEVLAFWIWKRLSVYGWPTGVSLSRVTVRETKRSSATIRGDVPDRDGR
jgi:6-pyruvoyltetrahydropterin/6-carboxytetrahydropterin synthase